VDDNSLSVVGLHRTSLGFVTEKMS